MATTRKVIRQMERQSLVGFDEQLWPINCVLLVLAGFVAGIIIAKSSFEVGPFWQNGWFRLSLLAVTLLALFMGTWWLHRRQHVRRMQLAVLLSLLLNLGIEVWLFRIHMNVPIHDNEAASSQWIDDREEVTLPDYGREPTEEAPPEDLERPVETVTAEVQPQAVDRQETTQPPTPAQRSVTAEPSATATQPAPSTLERAQTAVSAPRRTDQPSGSQVSRQEMRAPSTPTEAIPAPQTAVSAEGQPSPLNANVTPLERSTTREAQLAQRPPSPSAASATQVSPAQAQLQRSEATPVSPVAPRSLAASVTRQTPQLPQPVAADSALPAARAEAAATTQVAPSATQVARQQAAVPLTPQATSAPQTASVSQPAAANVARQLASQDAPQNPQPTTAAISRQAPSPAVTTEAAAIPTQPSAVAANSASSALQPAQAQLARQQAANIAASGAATGQATAADPAAPSAPVARAAPSRAAATVADGAAAAASANPGSVARASPAAANANTAAQPIAAPAAPATASAPGQLAASSSADVTRTATAAPATSGAATAGQTAAANAPAQQVGQAQMSRAAQPAALGMAAAPRPGQVGRTAASRTASTAASGAAEVPAAAVAEAGGTPAPSANSQATTVARSSGAVPLPAGSGPAQPVGGESLNTARGLAQAVPRRVETSADSILASNTPGTGPVARSQGVASSAAPATAVPLEAPTAAAGSLSQQPSAAPQSALTGVARATGQAPLAAPSTQTGTEPGSGATAGAPSSSGVSRANTTESVGGPQVGQGAASLARTTTAATGAGAGSAQVAEPATAGITAAGSAGSLEAAASQVARQAPSAGSRGGPAISAEAGAATSATGAIAGTGPTRAASSATPAADRGVLSAGSIARTSSESPAAGLATAEAAPLPAGAASQGPAGVATANVGSQAKQAAGLPGELLNRGEVTGETAPAIGTTAGTTAARRADAGAEVGPQLPGAVAMQAGRQTAASALPAGLATADEAGPVAGTTSSEPSTVAGQGPSAELTRQASGALPVQVAALAGPGSLAETASPLPGLPNRRARPDAEAIHQVAQRFLLDRTSGAPSLNARGFEKPAEAFLQRAPAQRPGTARSRGGSTDSERAVEMGLDYLAKQQLADGRWSLQNVATGGNAQDAAAGAGQMQADSASTGLGLLCFLGAGYTHVDGKYRDTVAAGVSHLVKSQKPDGDLFAGGSKYVWFYSHGIAAISLCEAYGMTKDPELREPAQKALNFILAAQHPTFGGWRYAPQASTDTSVSGWQVMALKSGELAGLSVPADAYAKVGRWLDGAQTLGGAQYSYRPEAQVAHQRNPSLAMTAEGLLMRLYTGWDRSNPQVVAGVEHLRQNLPSIGTRVQPLRDSYYWYYATQVMFQAQGDAWNAWNERLRNLLVNSQVQSGPLTGSWDPRGAVPDRWGLEGGRLYVTAMHLLMLEVYYRHLPLYKIDE